jgi:aspartyl-tRNA(Asn)/glutamyl-tRNA(Gln) amidotransferase subunit A
MADLAHASLADLARALAAKEVSAVELARLFLGRIDARRDLNAFLDVRPDVTLAQAAAADEPPDDPPGTAVGSQGLSTLP